MRGLRWPCKKIMKLWEVSWECAAFLDDLATVRCGDDAILHSGGAVPEGRWADPILAPDKHGSREVLKKRMKNKPKCRNTHIYVLAMNMIGEWMSIISGIYFTDSGFIRHLWHWESRTFRNYTVKFPGAQDDKAVWSPLHPSTIDWMSASIILAELLSSAPRFIWSLDVPKNVCECMKNVPGGILPQCR